MLADALQTTFEDAVPLPEVEFVVVDLETTGGSPTDSRITEIGAVKIRGGERTGVFETLVNPGRADPPPDLAPDRDRRPRGGRRAADRVGAAVVRGVRARLRLRGAQRPVRLHVPQRRARTPRLRPAATAAGVHRPPRAARRLARRAERAAPDARAVLPHGGATVAPGAARRRGVLRGPPRPARARRAARHRHARRPARRRPRPRAPELREDPARGPPAERAGRLPVPGSGRPRAVRRQVGRPAFARQELLLRRRPEEGRGPARRDLDGRRRPVRLGARVPDPRGPADPPSTSRSTTAGARRGGSTRTCGSTTPRRTRGSRSSARPRAAARSSGRSPRRTSRVWRRRRSRTSSRSAAAPRRCARPPGSRRARSPRCTDA